ncbi:MAG: response regulator transcription factor [Lachnospiraceae bacterium]|nr:response regulator transcription factor [Lachnospiraceae bacterium]
MYRVLIVDDEAFIREGLKVICDWEELGFSICGDAASGEEALQKILQEKPDLVLMDIKMPGMTGLEIIKKCKDAGSLSRFIVISGYSDFTYAQEAIRYGVTNYLTKPVDEDELIPTVKSIKEAMDKENRDTSHLVQIRRKAKDVILHEIVEGAQPLDHILTKEDIDELELDADIYQVVIYENFSLSQGSDSYSFADLLKVTNRGDHTFNHFLYDNKDIILLKGTYALNRFQDFLSKYEGPTPPQSGSPLDTLFLAYGRPVAQLAEVHKSYAEALTLVRRRFFCMNGQHTLGYEELPSVEAVSQEVSPATLQKYADDFVSYLQTFNRKKVISTLSELEDFLYDVKNDISEVKLFLTDLYLRIKEGISVVYQSASIPFESNTSVINLITDKHYLYEIIQFLSEQFEMIMNSTGNPSRNSVLDDVLYYIDHNYQNNIKLETIAPLFGYNSAYLGKIFSKTVGENFNSYVDHMRIEHSKELLLNKSLKVYEIAERVGYRNVDYFHKKFRKYVGLSPAEFRKQNSIIDDGGDE